MTKVLFLIMSDDTKFDLGIRISYNSFKNRRYDEMKVLFFGPSQKRLTQLDGDIKSMFHELLQNKIVDSACIGIAENMKIKPNLESLGISLMPTSERLAHFVREGYEIISF